MGDYIRHSFVWVGIETSGLDPANGQLLEIHIALARDAPGDDYSIVSEAGSVLYAPGVLEFGDEAALEIHQKNGLLAECQQDIYPTPTVADDEIEGMLRDICGLGPGMQMTLAGERSAFALRWIEQDLPKTRALFTNSPLDTTSVFAFFAASKAARVLNKPMKNARARRAQGKVHRALETMATVTQVTNEWKG